MDHNGGSYLMLMLEERVTGIHTGGKEAAYTIALRSKLESSNNSVS